MNKKILVVAAHPDDEILGVGGTILRHVNEGDTVHVLILAEGMTSRMQNDDVECPGLSELHESAAKVAKSLGVEKLSMANFPDNRMDSIPLLTIVKRIEKETESFVPDTVYTHYGGDVNIDHKLSHDAVVTAFRPLPGTLTSDIYFFETPSSTEWQMSEPGKLFIPNCYIDISAYVKKKIEVLHCYDSEMRRYPHPRSYKGIEIKAMQRGAEIGCEYAEAFAIGRIIRRT